MTELNDQYIFKVVRKNPGISISELSRKLEINRMTISRAVAVLEARSLLVVDNTNKKDKKLYPGFLKALENKRAKDK
jgi:predicted transcriptional regulator